jgi:hypothetical protein
MFNDSRFEATDDDFDENGVLKDGHSIRVRMTMMDHQPLTRAARRARQAAASSTVDAAKVTEAVIVTRRLMDSGAVDIFADHKPGFRYADQSPDADFGTGYSDPGPGGDLPPLGRARRTRRARTQRYDPEGREAGSSVTEESDAVSPRDAYIRMTADAWKTQAPTFDAGTDTGSRTRVMPNWPEGAYLPVGFGASDGDVVTWNGAPAILRRRGDYLFPETIDVGATRSGQSSGGAPPTRTDSMDAAQAQTIRDAAYQQYCTELESAWRT